MSAELRDGGRVGRPDLSITTPTYNRPDDLLRALRSVTDGAGVDAKDVELVVSDNSQDSRSEDLVRPVMDSWAGPATYVRHTPSLGKTENQNACLALATGRWQLILHDDDYLLTGGLQAILRAIRTADSEDRVLHFGVRVVNEHGSLLRRQAFSTRQHLPPSAALRRLLSDSSFVRMPAICVRSDVYTAVGDFDDTVGGANDTDMWIRIFALHGVTTIPNIVSAYVIHSDAATEATFNADGVAQIDELFRRAEATDVLPRAQVRAMKSDFVHQFVLAGCFRRLRRREWSGAREIMLLFSLPNVAVLGWSRQWAPVRAAFSIATGVMPRSGRA